MVAAVRSHLKVASEDGVQVLTAVLWKSGAAQVSVVSFKTRLSPLRGMMEVLALVLNLPGCRHPEAKMDLNSQACSR